GCDRHLYTRRANIRGPSRRKAGIHGHWLGHSELSCLQKLNFDSFVCPAFPYRKRPLRLPVLLGRRPWDRSQNMLKGYVMVSWKQPLYPYFLLQRFLLRPKGGGRKSVAISHKPLTDERL